MQCPSEDALLWVWSVTKAVLTRPQLVMDAISLFNLHTPPSVFAQHTAAFTKPQPTLPAGQKAGQTPKLTKDIYK